MSISYDTNINKFEVNMFEYCTLMKELKIPGAKSAYIKIHKLMPYCKKDKKFSPDTIFVNDKECKPKVSKSLELSNYVKVSIFNSSFNGLGKPIYKTITDEDGETIKLQVGSIIPKGTLMIVMFMDNNINDGYLTNFIANTGGVSI